MSMIDATDDQVLISIIRHPVFDENRRLWGYELFCVGSYTDTASGFPENDKVAIQVASSAYIGMQRIFARDKKVMVNFNEKTILDNLPYAFPPNLAAVKVTEKIYTHAAVPETLDRLKADGYLIAVSGFSGRAEFQPLYEMADIISIAVDNQSRPALESILASLSHLNVDMLATQVETDQWFQLCQDLGFSLFQGAFFKSPEVINIRKLSSNQTARLSILKMMETDEPDLERLAEMIQADATISFRMLSYLNSAAFGFKRKISSIQHAISILGWRKIKNWLRVVLLNDISQGSSHSSDLLILAAQRGKFLELIAKGNDYWGFDPDSLHLLGLFSLLDAMIGAPMSEIVGYLPLENKLKGALCREPNNEYAPLLHLARFVEEARWKEAESMIQQLNLDSPKVKAAFQAAVNWAAELTTLDETKI